MSKILVSIFQILVVANFIVVQAQPLDNEFSNGDGGAVVLLDERRLEIDNLNKATFTYHRIIKIFNEKGIGYCRVIERENAYIKIKKISAKLIDGNGEVIKKLDKGDIRTIPFSPGYILYDDVDYELFELAHTQFPFTIEYSCEQKFASLFFWPRWTPQADVPVLKSTYTLILNKPVEFKQYSIGDIPEATVTLSRGKTVYQWELNNISPKIDEDWMPPENEAQQLLLFTPVNFELGDYSGTFKSWDEFARWYRLLAQDRYALPEEARIKITGIINQDDTNKEKIEKLYSFLQDYTRYVEISLEIGAWQPHSAESVFVNKYGDCKDLSTFMISLLKEVGIEAYPALVKTRDEGVVIKDFPANQFNHVITYVPLSEDTLWLECTADYLACGKLPYTDEGCQVLVIKENRGEIIRTPISGSHENLWVSKIEARLIPAGALEFGGSIIAHGNQGRYLRNILNSYKPSEQKEWLERILGRYVPKVLLTDMSFENLTEKFNLPLKIKFQGRVDNFAKKSASRLFFNPNVFNRVDSGDIPDEEERKFAVHYNYAYMDVDTAIIDLPLGYVVEAAPETKDIQSEFIDFNQSLTFENNELIFARKYDLKQQQIPVSFYSHFKDILNDISKIDNSKIVLRQR